MEKYVYELINSLGIVEYVGETNNPDRRFREHTTHKPGYENGKFYKRNDIKMNVVSKFSNAADAREFEGELKIKYGLEWSEFTRTSKVGKYTAKQNSLKYRAKAVFVYDYKTNKLINEYYSLREACRELSIHPGLCIEVLKGIRKQTKGFYLKYK